MDSGKKSIIKLSNTYMVKVSHCYYKTATIHELVLSIEIHVQFTWV